MKISYNPKSSLAAITPLTAANDDIIFDLYASKLWAKGVRIGADWADISSKPSSLKNPHALTISLNGTSQGPYDGSTAKNINITPGSIGAATSGHNHDGRYVYNYGGTAMDANSLNKNALGMSTNSGITGDWWHILQAGWNNEYRWNSLIAFPTQNKNGMYYRSGLDNNTAWGDWVKLLDVSNSYVTGGKGYINGTEITLVNNASKLQTARNLWGQSFDGTANISGTLSGVAHIQFSADNAYDIGSNSVSSRCIYTYWLGAKSGLKLELGANNSNFGLGLCIDTNLNVGIGTNTPAYKLHVNGTFRAANSTVSDLFVNTGDATLKIYTGRTTDALNDGNICFLTSIDATDGQSHVYPTLHLNRCNIVLQPRGGLVYIGTNPDIGNITYKLYVNSKIFSNGGFVKNGSSDSYVLLGGGGHKAISDFATSSHTHTVFKNNLMIKGTNGISDSASIHLGIGDSDTGFKWISDGKCLIYANNAAVGEWTSGGMNWFKNPTVNGNKIWNAGNDGSGSGLDADTVDGVHVNQLCRIYTFNVHNSIIKVGTLTSGQYGHVCKLRFNSGIGYSADNTDKTMTVVIRASNGNANSNGFYFESHSESYRGRAFTTFYLHQTSKTQCELYMDAFNYSGQSTYEVSFSNGDSWANEISVQNALPTSNIFALPNYQIAYTDYNVASATKLQTPRNLWGNSFDGTKDINGSIVFPNIGDTATSNKISWSGSSDGADIYYLTTASDLGNLVLNVKDDTNAYILLALNGTFKSHFDVANSYWTGRSAQADKWTTARTFTIGNTTKNVDGSGNVSWSLAEIGVRDTWRTVQVNDTSIGNNILNLCGSTYIGLTNVNGKVTFSLVGSGTTANQAILSNGTANGWTLKTLNIDNWNTAYNFVSTITGADTDNIINKWDEIVNFLAGITEDNKLNTLLNSKLSVYELANNTNVEAIKNNGIYYSTTDASSGTLTNSPFNTGFALINMTSYDGGDDLRRSRLAFNAYGEIKVSNDRDLANTVETWYNVLTSKNSGINGSTIKLNGTSITVYSSNTADGRYVKKSGDTMSGVLTINTTNFGALTIKRNDDANGASIQFRGKSSVYGYIGLNNSTKDKLFLRWNSDTSKTYTILDTSSTYTSNGKGVINGTTITQVDNATNSTNSTNARKLVNWYSARQTSLNTQFGDGSLRIFYATSSTTEGKPAEDSHILHLAWDNNGGWDAQLAVHTRSGKVSTRAQNSGTWKPWKTLAFTTDIPSSLKNPHALTLKANGTTLATYDGSSAKEANFTYANVGAASANHNHDNRYVRKWTGVYGNANKFLKLVIGEEKGWIRLEVSDSNNGLTGGYGIYMIGWGWHGDNNGDTLFARCLYANNSRYTTALKIVRTSRNNYDFYFLFASGSSYPSYTINYSSSVSSIDCTVTAIDTIPTATWTSSLSALQLNASSATNADTLDNYHANGLFTALSNSNNGISITVGGTTKSVSNISVNHANSAGSATKVIVNLHTANDINYPLVWSNLSNTSNATENQLFKSWLDLYYNPKNKRLFVRGSISTANINATGTVTSAGFKHSGVTENADLYVLTAGGGYTFLNLASNELAHEFSKDITVTSEWADIEDFYGGNLNFLTLPGTYIVLVYYNDNSADGMYEGYFSGIMSWFTGTTNSNNADEIVLHRVGHAYANTIYLRTRESLESETNPYTKLQISANTTLKQHTYKFKFKRIC